VGKKFKKLPLSYVNLGYYIESGVRTEDDREVLIDEIITEKKPHAQCESEVFYT
jgi:hypothetical protein